MNYAENTSMKQCTTFDMEHLSPLPMQKLRDIHFLKVQVALGRIYFELPLQH